MDNKSKEIGADGIGTCNWHIQADESRGTQNTFTSWGSAPDELQIRP